MNTARVVVLAIAPSAGGVAACLAGGTDKKPPPAAPVAQPPTADALAAKSGIGLGRTVKREDPYRQAWPTASKPTRQRR